MSNFANKVTSAAPCHTVFVRTKRKRFAYVTAGNGQDRVSCVVGGGVRCSQQGVGGESLPIPQPVWRFGTLRQALQRDAHAIGRREHPDLAGILPKEGRKPMKLYHGSTVDIPHVDLRSLSPTRILAWLSIYRMTSSRHWRWHSSVQNLRRLLPSSRCMSLTRLFLRSFKSSCFRLILRSGHTSSMTIE